MKLLLKQQQILLPVKSLHHFSHTHQSYHGFRTKQCNFTGSQSPVKSKMFTITFIKESTSNVHFAS